MTRFSRRVAVVATLVAVFGLADSAYLTIKHLQGSYIRCGDECSAVLGSRYAEGIVGIPLAGFGALAYSIIILATIAAAFGSRLGRRIFTVLTVIMAAFSAWLIYLQAFVIHLFCKYCLGSAAACFTLVGLVLFDRLMESRNTKIAVARRGEL